MRLVISITTSLLVASTLAPCASAQIHPRVLEISVVPRPANIHQWTARTTSPNGLVIAGGCFYDDGTQFGAEGLFVWTPDTGATTIALPGGAPGDFQNVRAVSDDGATLLANFQGPDGWDAWLWRQTGGWTQLPLHSEAVNDYNPGLDMSADGSVVLGWNWFERPEYCSNFQFDFRPVIWQNAGAAQIISDWYSAGPCLFGASGGPTQQEVFLAHSMAAYETERFAGTGWVYESEIPARRDHAHTLNGVGGAATAHGKPMDAIDAVLTAYSPNGRHAIGMANMGTSRRILRVTDGGALEELGDSYPNPSDAQTLDYVSNDGKTILATTRENAGSRYIWTESGGWSLLRDWIADQCIDVLQFEFMFAVGAGPDARLMAGNARNFLGEWQVWRIAPVEGPDTDGDGLLDDWETNGLDINQDGVIDLPLNIMGADPMHKDLFVEVDRMRNVPFSTGALDLVITAFENAPVSNPDGTTGINLWIDYGTIDVMNRVSVADWTTFRTIKDGSGGSDQGEFGTDAERTDSNWDAIRCAREAVFRYALFVDQLSDGAGGVSLASGLAEGVWCNDFMIATGTFDDQLSSAGQSLTDTLIGWVFMHELGHALGLDEGGGDDLTHKPNYVSVMNYSWPHMRLLNGNMLPLDYSAEALATLNEGSLVEADGVDSTLSRNVLSVHGFYDGSVFGQNARKVWLNGSRNDWNGDGVASFDPSFTVAEDANRLTDDDPTPGEALNGFNDWANIILPIGAGGSFASAVYGDLASLARNDAPADLTALLLASPPADIACRADIDGDGAVAGSDLAALLAEWGATDGLMDLNADGVTDGADLAALLAAWGACA
jgi:hypothetical protein